MNKSLTTASNQAFAIRRTDVQFLDSPDDGHPDCICSRCGQVITDEHPAIRAWPADSRYELRYHPRCLGVQAWPDLDDWNPDSECDHSGLEPKD